jgi:hypothetical protein
MKASDANVLTTGSAIFYKDLVSLQNMKASVGAITKNQSITVAVTTPALNLTWPLSGDLSVEIPITGLN